MKKEKIKTRCYGCGGYDTHTFGKYFSGAELGNRVKEKKVENDIAVVEYNQSKRFVCLNIECSLKDFYYCTHKNNKGEGKYYIVRLDRLYAYNEAVELYREMGEIIENKEVGEKWKKAEPDFYKWAVKDKGKRPYNIISKHIKKRNDLKKKQTEYETKLNNITNELQSVKVRLEKLHAEEMSNKSV